MTENHPIEEADRRTPTDPTKLHPRNQQAWKHGMLESPEYGVWRGMISRCEYKRGAAYKHYGAKGIRVCERWRHSFTTFFADMGPRPSPKHSIDRIDSNGNYEPGNCRWATWAEQTRNRSNIRFVEYDGKRLCIADWSKITGLACDVIAHRLDKGLSPEAALTTPLANRPREETECLHWGKQFMPNRSGNNRPHRFCSKACARKNSFSLLREKPCANCKAMFKPEAYTAKYCGLKCSSLARARREGRERQ